MTHTEKILLVNSALATVLEYPIDSESSAQVTENSLNDVESFYENLRECSLWTCGINTMIGVLKACEFNDNLVMDGEAGEQLYLAFSKFLALGGFKLSRSVLEVAEVEE